MSNNTDQNSKIAISSSRRAFLFNGTASVALGSVMPSQAFASLAKPTQASAKGGDGKFMFLPASERFMSMFKLKYPIIQAPAGGVVTSDLVAAVCNAGCLGGLPLSWSSAERARKTIATVQSKTDSDFFANFVLNFEPVALSAALEAGVKAIQFSWGMPTKLQVKNIRSFNALLGIQVTSAESASFAIDLGADYLVCQGTEAGGHVHASMQLDDALEKVLAVAGNVPVIASGGIAAGKDIHKLLVAGAAGVVMGTRFVATKESGAHKEYKDSLLKARSEHTVFTSCMNKGWDNATHRILRNSTFTRWEKLGCPKVGARPGEHDKIARYGNATDGEYTIERYSIDSPGKSISGDIEALANYAGTGVDNINDIPGVADLVDRIWQEIEEQHQKIKF